MFYVKKKQYSYLLLELQLQFCISHWVCTSPVQHDIAQHWRQAQSDHIHRQMSLKSFCAWLHTKHVKFERFVSQLALRHSTRTGETSLCSASYVGCQHDTASLCCREPALAALHACSWYATPAPEAIGWYLLPTGCSAENALLLSFDGTDKWKDRRTDGQTDGRSTVSLTRPAFCMWAVSKTLRWLQSRHVEKFRECQLMLEKLQSKKINKNIIQNCFHTP